jgi:FtsH-binding integral membrane protein
MPSEFTTRDETAPRLSDGAATLPGVQARTVSTATLLGQVMFLVAVAIGFMVLGSVLGRDLSRGTALAFSIGAFGMLMIQAFGGQRFRVGSFALGWLFAVGLAIGLGLGPVLAYYASADPTVITQAAGATALIVAAMGTGGLALGKDLSGWMRPLSFAIFGLVLLSLVLVLVGSGGSPFLSLAIAGVSALLILVDFNFLRKHGTEDHVVLLATGIFVSIVNIFISMLNLLSD